MEKDARQREPESVSLSNQSKQSKQLKSMQIAELEKKKKIPLKLLSDLFT